MTFNIYRNGELIETNLDAADERAALALYADLTGITGEVKRDGGGLLYVGDGTQGRYRARAMADDEAVKAWQAKYPHSPFGTPLVLAEAIESVGGLA